MLDVIAYTGGWNSPGMFNRVEHYREPLLRFDVRMTQCPSLAGCYPPEPTWLRPAWAVWNVVDRAPDAVRSLAYDLVFFQREMLSTFVTWEPFTKHPRVLDVDDAIWLHRRGSFAHRLAGLCDHVICGNDFLAAEFSRSNRSVSILPTPVNTDVYRPAPSLLHDGPRVIGWVGLPNGFPYLYRIEPALRAVLRNNPNAILRIVSSKRPRFTDLPKDQFEYVKWEREDEARQMQRLTVGIMPLDHSASSRGKCAYKMLLYMACGVPVVVTPTGMNADVLRQGRVGFGATTDREWVDGMTQLLRDPALCAEMGKVGRDVVLAHYSVDKLAPVLAKTLHRVAGK